MSFRIKKGDIRESVEVNYGVDKLEVTCLEQTVASVLLANRVVSHQCDYNCGLKKLEIRLKKEAEGVNWVNLDRAEGTEAMGGVGVRA